MKFFAGILASGLVLVFAPSALATTYHPNKTGDHVPNGCSHSDCTLREAVSAANLHPGSDRIVLVGGKSYSVTRDSSNIEDDNVAADLDVGGPLTIKSSNRKLAQINAHSENRVLDLPIVTSLSLIRIWVRNGRSDSGGGINSNDGGHLRLSRSRVTGSRAVTGNGGGIYTSTAGASLKIYRSTISGNRAFGDGGGIEAVDQGPLVVTTSTVSGNVAGTNGSGTGGGIDLINGATKLTLTNSTVADNEAPGDGGGIEVYDAGAAISSSTIVRNVADSDGGGGDFGGGIATVNNGHTISVRNSILALNKGGGGSGNANCYANFGSGVSSLGRNLLSAAATGFECPNLNSSPNLIQSNPHLGKLKDNGGPTKTVAVHKHSKAINRSGSGAPNRDQRGVKRYRRADIGAFEYRP